MLPLKLKPEMFKPSRRQFLLGAAVAGAGLSISFRVPGAREISHASRGKPQRHAVLPGKRWTRRRGSAGVSLALSSRDRLAAEMKGGSPCSI